MGDRGFEGDQDMATGADDTSVPPVQGKPAALRATSPEDVTGASSSAFNSRNSCSDGAGSMCVEDDELVSSRQVRLSFASGDVTGLSVASGGPDPLAMFCDAATHAVPGQPVPGILKAQSGGRDAVHPAAPAAQNVLTASLARAERKATIRQVMLEAETGDGPSVAVDTRRLWRPDPNKYTVHDLSSVGTELSDEAQQKSALMDCLQRARAVKAKVRGGADAAMDSDAMPIFVPRQKAPTASANAGGRQSQGQRVRGKGSKGSKGRGAPTLHHLVNDDGEIDVQHFSGAMVLDTQPHSRSPAPQPGVTLSFKPKRKGRRSARTTNSEMDS